MESYGRMLVLGALAAALVAACTTRLSKPGAVAEGNALRIVPFFVERVRVPARIAGQVLVINTSPAEVVVSAVRVRSAAGATVAGGPDEEVLLGAAQPEYEEANRLIAQLPPELTHEDPEQRARFGGTDAATIRDPAEIAKTLQKIADRVVAVRNQLSAGTRPSFAAIDVDLPLDEMFRAAADETGTLPLSVEVDYRSNEPSSRLLTARNPHRVAVRRVRSWAPLPPPYDTQWQRHAGDLHVHSCFGEALGGCADHCLAETTQIKGSFTYEQLKTQMVGKQLSWFTATDHSYCISDANYQEITKQTSRLTDASFVVLPDIELSSSDRFSKKDKGDLICDAIGPKVGTNHMGAHGLAARLKGGDRNVFGFCRDLTDFEKNVKTIRAAGGFAIANHPYGPTSFGPIKFQTFSWNRAPAAGVEGNGLHGVEIWNGEKGPGSSGCEPGEAVPNGLRDWLDWMRQGRVLYAYSGSDVHDQAVDFGANHVLLSEPLTPGSLLAALKAGRLFVSDGPALVLDGEVGNAPVLMGDIVEDPPKREVRLNVRFNGDGAPRVTLCKGTVRTGGGGRVEVPLSPSATTGNDRQYIDEPAPGACVWYRAHARDGDREAFTNPIFVRSKECGSTQRMERRR